MSLVYTLHDPPALAKAEPSKTRAAPLIMLHGLFGSKQNYGSISKYVFSPSLHLNKLLLPVEKYGLMSTKRVLARDLKTSVYAVDLRNHGDSPHDPIHDYETMAEDVENFIHAHGLKTAVVIGHSMGAKVAMTMALRSRVQLKALVSVDNAPVEAALKSDFSKYVRGLEEVERAKVSNQVEADEVLKSYEERARGINHLRLRIPIGFLAASLARMGSFPFKDPDDARYEGPTLFIRGTRSRYVNDDALPVIGSFFPRFELRDIDCGHWVISEKPEAFKEAVVDFLSQQDASS
ncbi:hypothetical protein MMC29_002647 [Sticta canariensis]|nr:hypothetical protein [Sticta canariensis]